METKFYEFSQNNTGGSFDVGDTLCHTLVIEAVSEKDAIYKAEDLGCYWNGVEDGSDCPCCGDRWYPSPSEINLDKFNEKGYEVYLYDHVPNVEQEWEKLYGHLPIVKKPKWETVYGSKRYTGSVKFETLQQYCQFMADTYGWTTPDIRIFHLDGKIDEIYSKKVK